jgi:hypothetical protein
MQDGGGFHLVRLVLPDRLKPGDRHLRQLGKVVSEATKGAAAASDEGHAEYRTMELKHLLSPQESEVVARDAVAKVFGTENNHRHFMYHLYPSRPGLAVVAVESEEPDTVLQYIADQAKYGAGQCTGKRPALVLVQLVEINPEDIRSLLDTPSGIHFPARAPSGILELALTPERVAKNEPFLVSVMAEAEGSAPREIGSLAFFPPPRPGDTRQFLIDISELPDTGRAKLVIRLVPAEREPLTQTRLRVNGIKFPERAH